MIISAAIFDLDGTIIDSRKQWTKAFLDVLKTLGKEEKSDPVEHGASIKSNWEKLLTKYQIKTDKTLVELEEMTYKYYVSYLSEVTLIDGARNFIDKLKKNEIKVALATGCEKWVVERIFDNLSLEGIFDTTVTGDKIENKKPAPDTLLVAARRLGTDLENCLAVGDTDVDIEAAERAGMKVVIIAGSGEGIIEFSKADIVVERFDDLTFEAIDQL